MHLHGYLRQCIEDFGPVYSFCCFSFERLNGILGSYHTNNHHISVQLMRHFSEGKIYAPENWPVDFTQEYLTLLQRFNYNKGALMQTTLENEIRYNKNSEICQLPPIKECAFLAYELDDLQTLFSAERGSPHRVLVLYHRCSAIMLKTQTHSSHVLGAKNSRHSRSSQVLCQRNDCEDIGLAEVHFFAWCNVKNDYGEQHTLWMAEVSWYMPHNCLVWYGIPA